MGKNSSPEEHFTLTDPVQVRIQLQGFDLSVRKIYACDWQVTTFLTKYINCQVCINSYHEDTGLLSIHKALGDGIWCEDLISEIILGENKLETKDS